MMEKARLSTVDVFQEPSSPHRLNGSTGNSPYAILDVKDREIRATAVGKSIAWYVDNQLADGSWREQVIPADIVGLSRDVVVFRGPRKTNLIAYDWHGDQNTFCPRAPSYPAFPSSFDQ